MQNSYVGEVGDGNWEQMVEKEPKPVLVMFYLTTCSHCKAIEPYFREFAETYKDSCKFFKVNAEINPWVSERYGVEGTPTFMFMCAGKMIRGMAGVSHPSELKRNIEDFLKNGSVCAANVTSLKYDMSLYG
ncbi:thioredoxin family protein [Methanococcoides alaskense]|uniref:Thioredoxin-like negative regulator of GroEL n=1 Tax=Methanococcoides alaskense TaxID=325778 RepID=A0AA90U0R0_9EURY|nr:thioredoxin family protein [Methanococcoides alaskense]MDR6223557.1 thioredoxin-like negative regulator of GroEL [Methanococcoides alaskense]